MMKLTWQCARRSFNNIDTHTASDRSDVLCISKPRTQRQTQQNSRFPRLNEDPRKHRAQFTWKQLYLRSVVTSHHTSGQAERHLRSCKAQTESEQLTEVEEKCDVRYPIPTVPLKYWLAARDEIAKTEIWIWWNVVPKHSLFSFLVCWTEPYQFICSCQTSLSL